MRSSLHIPPALIKRALSVLLGWLGSFVKPPDLMEDLGHSQERGSEAPCVDGCEHLKLCVAFVLFHFSSVIVCCTVTVG